MTLLGVDPENTVLALGSIQAYLEVTADFYTPDGAYDFSALILLDGDTLVPHRVQRRLLKSMSRRNK